MSCRIHPDLKRELEEEAALADLTTSNYVERILHNRHFSEEEESPTQLLEKIHHLEAELEAVRAEHFETDGDNFSSETKLLREQIEILQIEKEELSDTVQSYREILEEQDDLTSQNGQLLQQVRELSEKIKHKTNQLPFELSELESMKLNLYLEDLEGYHPDASPTDLLLGSLDTTIRAEKARWTIPTIKKFLKQSKLIEA